MKRFATRLSVVFLGLCFAWPAFALSLTFENPLKSASLPQLIENVTQNLVKVGIPFVVVVIIFGGFRFITATAQGNETKLKEARTLLMWTIVGAAVIIGSWALVWAAVNFANTL